MDDMFLALLDLSRLDANVVKPLIQRFPISLILARLDVEFTPQAAAKGLTMVFDPCADWVESDASLVQQILSNLIANAVRYTTTGQITIQCSRHEGKLRITVRDTGIGISPHQQKTVFEEFCQLGNASRDRTKGLGLGLAIVKRLCKLLGMPITLVSGLGQGSSFAIDLPLTASREEGKIIEPVVERDTDQDFLRNKLIVVIDDEENILGAMRMLLEQWGCIVVTAASGSEAVVELAAVERLPDALICDYRLRLNKTGFDVISMLNDEFNLEIPALLITGDTAPDLLQEMLASGLPMLYKPVQAGILRDALIRLIRSGSDK